MIFKQKTVLGFVLAVSICVVYADFGLTNPVKPISTGGDSQRAQDFQKIVEKHFTAGDRLLMPLGMYSVNFRGVSTKEIKRLVRNGITFIQRYTGSLTVERLNENIINAAKANVPMALCLPTHHYHKDKEWWRKFIQDRDLINQKQIKIWYLHGEPKDQESLNQLRHVASLLHELDGSRRPVISYHHSLDTTAKEMCQFLDALVSGIYPGLSKHRGLPRVRIAYRMDSIPKRYGTPAIAALESYNTPSGWPSPKEIKFDAYLALIHEAKGIMWYNYHQLRNKPELVNAVLAVARTLNGPEHLGEVFLKGKDNQDIQARILAGPKVFPDRDSKLINHYLGGNIYPSVHWRGYNHRGYAYLVMVNCCEILEGPHSSGADEESLTVKVEFRGFNANSKIALLDGENEYSYQSGTLTVTLKPLGAAVFKVTHSN